MSQTVGGVVPPESKLHMPVFAGEVVPMKIGDRRLVALMAFCGVLGFVVPLLAAGKAQPQKHPDPVGPRVRTWTRPAERRRRPMPRWPAPKQR